MERGEELMELNRAAAERNTEAYERNREAFERNRDAVERVMATLDRHEQMLEENKLFIRDMNRRSERVVQNLVEGNRRFLSDLSSKLATEFGELSRELKDGREEARAKTQALLTLIDRLPPPAQAA